MTNIKIKFSVDYNLIVVDFSGEYVRKNLLRLEYMNFSFLFSVQILPIILSTLSKHVRKKIS